MKANLQPIIWVGAGWLVSVSSAMAAPMGTATTYQGLLEDAGVSVTGQVNMIFTLKNDELAGITVGSAVIFDGQPGNGPPVDVTDGLFTVRPDFGANVFDGTALFLEIQVRSPHDPTDTAMYTPLDPRQAITAAPVALQTRGIFVEEPSGNVGIGTIMPQSPLHVTGLITSGEAGVTDGEIRLEDSAAITNNPGIRTNTDGDLILRSHSLDGDIEFETGNPESRRMVILQNGNVGIGTTTPGADLHVKGPDGVIISSSAAAPALFLIDDGDNDLFKIQHARAANQLRIRNASNTDLLVIEKTGNVGIGTTTPTNKLTVTGNADFTGNVGIGTNSPNESLEVVGNIESTGTVTASAFSSASPLLLQTAGTTRIHVDDVTGNVGIGNDTAPNSLSVSGDADFTGNVGIGTTTPTNKLSVTGNADFTGNVGIGTNSPQSVLQVRSKPTESGIFDAETTAAALLTSLTDNGGNTPATPESVLILAREGIAGEAWANFARFDLSRYEDNFSNSRSQLDLRLSHGGLAVEGNNTPTIMSLQSGGNVGIGTASPTSALDIGGGNISLNGGWLSGDGGNEGVFVRNNGKVGIGTTLPDNKLTVTGNADFTGNVGIGTTTPATQLHVSDTGTKAALAVQRTDGKYLVLLAAANVAGLGFDDTGVLHIGPTAAIGNTPAEASSLIVDSAGDVGIGRQPAKNALEVEGEASKSGGGFWMVNSDRRIKKNIETVEGALDALDKVRLVSFEYTDNYRKAHAGVGPRRYLNVIAQEFAKVFPDYVKSSGERLPDGSEILQVDAYPLTIYAAAAVQELNAEMKAKDQKIADLTARLERMEAMMARLVETKTGGAR